jgi:hypothetical protein
MFWDARCSGQYCRNEMRIPILKSERFCTRRPDNCSAHNYGAFANQGASKFMPFGPWLGNGV